MSCCVQWMSQGVVVGGGGGELGFHHGLSRPVSQRGIAFSCWLPYIMTQVPSQEEEGMGGTPRKARTSRGSQRSHGACQWCPSKCTSQDLVPAPSSSHFSRHPNACDEGQAGGHLALVLNVVLSKEVDEGDLLFLNALSKEAPAG